MPDPIVQRTHVPNESLRKATLSQLRPSTSIPQAYNEPPMAKNPSAATAISLITQATKQHGQPLPENYAPIRMRTLEPKQLRLVKRIEP